MSVNVPLERLRAELERRGNVAYLLTVGDDGRPHCVAVSVHWESEDLVMGSGTTSTHNATARRLVTLLTPPVEADETAGYGGADTGGADAAGYSLIVDGEVTTAATNDAGGGTVKVRPTHAVLHRPATGATGHDCAHVFGAVRKAGGEL